ncbi:class III extradiol dioxygenase subunit B-like domain-containing protein [Streptomyces sp. CRN 30]|uniref:class III extradiol dioxygenase subunit B-like domain-containing protein n=1 Tax=Streptomyces sp. CRN 30 TaxID=3075613 RepID=UPI002A7ED86C|nr:class III extradiol dioxygenase subunit B-like domain-containing protein [Streptomyces sp. CRN 30]
MLVAAAVCPCPPLLVPEVAAGAAPELDAARTACADALGVLAAARPGLLVVVGPGEDAGPRTYPQGTPGSFRGFGVDADVRLGAAGDARTDAAGDDPLTGAEAGPELPYGLAVGAWLLERAAWADAPVEGIGVGPALDAGRCAALGRDLAARAGRVAMLVLGDASACRTLKAPGYLDERAAPFDASVARALGRADLTALAALDTDLARELRVSGRAPWQLLAAAAEDAALDGTLLYEDAPYGVGYVVAAWS